MGKLSRISSGKLRVTNNNDNLNFLMYLAG